MGSWVRTITSPLKKLFNQNNPRDKKSQQGHDNRVVADHLHGEVMACGYEDVQVMWSMLDKSKSKSKPRLCNITS